MHPSNPWDLKGYCEKSGESLRDYIRRFSQKYHELPNVSDADVIFAFWDSTTCRTLVHELSYDQPKTTKELLNIATQHASSEEAVGAAFVLGNVAAAVDGGTTPTLATTKGARKGAKGGKMGQKRPLVMLP
jgi:hypothetical protein